MARSSSTLRAWLIGWPVLLPIYAVVVIFYPIAWITRGIWRAVTRWH